MLPICAAICIWSTVNNICIRIWQKISWIWYRFCLYISAAIFYQVHFFFHFYICPKMMFTIVLWGLDFFPIYIRTRQFWYFIYFYFVLFYIFNLNIFEPEYPLVYLIISQSIYTRVCQCLSTYLLQDMNKTANTEAFNHLSYFSTLSSYLSPVSPLQLLLSSTLAPSLTSLPIPLPYPISSVQPSPLH